MKKILALSLMLVLVLSMGVFAKEKVVDRPFAADMGTLEGDEDFLQIKADVSITIDKYARVWLRENKLFNGTILGQPGLYTSDEDQVIRDAKNYFGFNDLADYWPEADLENWMGKGDEDEGYDRNGGALFRVESNCDALVDVDFAWGNAEKKLNSELVFWVYRHVDDDEWGWYPPVNNEAALSLITTKNPEKALQFRHVYVNDKYGFEYKIGGALFIDYISQQKADTYNGVITITVSAAQDEVAL